MTIEVKAKIYHVTDSQTSVKAFANVDIGGVLYINSYTVSNKIDDLERIYAFPPSYRRKNGGGYCPYIELPDNKNNPLAAAIHNACLSAYQHYENTHQLHEYGDSYFIELEKYSQERREATGQDGKGKKEPLGGWDSNGDEIKFKDIPF